jgi:hypothetical protein
MSDQWSNSRRDENQPDPLAGGADLSDRGTGFASSTSAGSSATASTGQRGQSPSQDSIAGRCVTEDRPDRKSGDEQGAGDRN